MNDEILQTNSCFFPQREKEEWPTQLPDLTHKSTAERTLLLLHEKQVILAHFSFISIISK